MTLPEPRLLFGCAFYAIYPIARLADAGAVAFDDMRELPRLSPALWLLQVGYFVNAVGTR